MIKKNRILTRWFTFYFGPIFDRVASRVGNKMNHICICILVIINALKFKTYFILLTKHYCFSATVANLQSKVESLTTTNALMKEDLAIAKNTMIQLVEENNQLKHALGIPFLYLYLMVITFLFYKTVFEENVMNLVHLYLNICMIYYYYKFQLFCVFRILPYYVAIKYCR